LTSPNADWPALNFADWEATCDTLHMWTQIVGKTRMVFAPRENHWWNVTLRVTPRGLTTTPIPYHHSTFDVEFDFVAHRLLIRKSEGQEHSIPLYARSVADFYAEYMASLRALGIEVKIDCAPAEFDDPCPHDQDQHHASYDAAHVESFRRILIQSDRVFKKFRSRFIGKCSPVQFFWGSFDLAVTRFSGRPATLGPDVDPVTREAYSHEVISCGFWPGDRKFKQPAFYSYTAPAPAGLDKEHYWNTQMGEFLLTYNDARSAESPDQAILDFCQSTYESGARLAQWDRAALERS
jgi:Family of unknown function (DUF5996)